MIIYATELRFVNEDAASKVLTAAAAWLSRKARRPLLPELLADDHSLRIGPGVQLQTWCDKTARPHLYALKLTHGDREVRGRQWITELGVSDPGDSGNVRATVLLETSEISARVQAAPQTTRPLLVDQILKSCPTVNDTPGFAIRSLTSESAHGYEYLASDERRRYPLIVVSPTAEGSYLVDPERVRSLVSGLADVVTIPAGEDTFELADHLGPEYVAWLGAVNVIFPMRRRGTRRFAPRRRLLPDELAEIVAEGRSPESEILSLVAHRMNLPNSKLHIRPEDVREAAISREMVRRRQAADEAGSEAQLLPLYEEIDRDQKREIGALKDKVNALEDDNLQLSEDVDGLETEKRNLGFQIDSLKSALGDGGQTGTRDSAISTSIEYREAVLDAIAGSPSLEQSLRIIEHLFGDRIVILDSAWKSARDAVGFVKTRKTFELLRTLATVYWEDLASGKGDGEARHHFGKAYAPRESETVRKNKKAKALRTFDYNGKAVEMWRHIKIGVKPSVSETLRVHFHWDDSNKRIVIGHCGEHLDHS